MNQQNIEKAGDGLRTRYLELGKLTLYRLSYAREKVLNYPANDHGCQSFNPQTERNQDTGSRNGSTPSGEHLPAMRHHQSKDGGYVFKVWRAA